MIKWQQRKRLITRRGLVYSLLLCLVILGLGGVGFWLLEPQIERDLMHEIGTLRREVRSLHDACVNSRPRLKQR